MHDFCCWQTLKPRGWAEPDPAYDKADTLLETRIFVLEHGFGVLKKAPKKKRGWGPCSIDCHDGGKKTLILRLKGKEMGTPFLIAPAADVEQQQQQKLEPEPEPEPGSTQAEEAQLAQWRDLAPLPWGRQVSSLMSQKPSTSTAAVYGLFPYNP